MYLPSLSLISNQLNIITFCGIVKLHIVLSNFCLIELYRFFFYNQVAFFIVNSPLTDDPKLLCLQFPAIG